MSTPRKSDITTRNIFGHDPESLEYALRISTNIFTGLSGEKHRELADELNKNSTANKIRALDDLAAAGLFSRFDSEEEKVKVITYLGAHSHAPHISALVDVHNSNLLDGVAGEELHRIIEKLSTTRTAAEIEALAVAASNGNLDEVRDKIGIFIDMSRSLTPEEIEGLKPSDAQTIASGAPKTTLKGPGTEPLLEAQAIVEIE